MTMNNDRKIKNLYINKGLQFKVIITAMMYMFLVLIVTVGAILFPIIYEMLSSNDLNVQYKAAQTFLILAKRLLPCTIVLFTFFFVHLSIITHRICGPLMNFTNTFSRIASGDLTRKIHLRKGDYLKRECDQINFMIDGLSEHVKSVKIDHDKMSAILEEALESIENIDTKAKIEKILDEVKGEASVVAEDLSQFKIAESDK